MSTATMSPTKRAKNTAAPHPANLTFPLAVAAIIDGKRVTKREWKDETIWLALIDGFLKIHKADGSEHALLVSDGDLLGTDWYLL